jgi:5-methylcytosine-specific restriction endonuclease McrA
MKNYRYIIGDGTRRIAGRYEVGQAAAQVLAAPSEEQKARPQFHGSYGGLLFDPRWKAKRAEILQRDNDCCIICRDSVDLQVHHRQYHYVEQANAFRMPWDYPDQLLITLCKSCHNRGHAKFKVPTLIIR